MALAPNCETCYWRWHCPRASRVVLYVIMVALALGIVGCKSNPDPAPGVLETVKIESGNRGREYLLYSPSSLSSGSGQHPLIVVLHGGGGTATQIMRETGETFFRLAEKDGFYVVFPDSINKMWDFGSGKVSTELDERIDDRSYFEFVLNDVAANLPIDESRVFATGISRGGQASYFLACEFPDRIRAIAPVAMPMPAFMAESCKAGPPIGIAIMNGTDDPLVPYNGGTIKVGRKDRGDVLSTTDTIALWNSRNGCTSSQRLESVLDAASDRMHVEVTEWRECSGAPVVLYKIVGGGHTWPSGSQYLPAFIVGRATKDIDGAEVAWSFFREFR